MPPSSSARREPTEKAATSLDSPTATVRIEIPAAAELPPTPSGGAAEAGLMSPPNTKDTLLRTVMRTAFPAGPGTNLCDAGRVGSAA